MSEVGIRALKQNSSAVVARAASGEAMTITDRGRPVARITAIPKSRLQSLIEEGLVRPAKLRIEDIPHPEPGPTNLTDVLLGMRDNERY